MKSNINILKELDIKIVSREFTPLPWKEIVWSPEIISRPS